MAALIYTAFAAGRYAPSWATASDKPRWRAAAVAVLGAFNEEEI